MTGTASFSDGAPLSKGVVMFNGDAGSFSGSIGADGKYTLEGVLPGTYKVVVTGVMDKEANLDMNYDEQGNYVESNEEPPKSLILADYGDIAKTPLSMTVPSGDYNIKVEKAN
ncbi:MAG: carboxypeptidase-like regulatory domain-containing protein [Planctomycetaceae bacterium]